MNEPGFDVFAGLWRQAPAQEEVRLFRALAARTGQRARLIRHCESAAGAAIFVGIIAAYLQLRSPLAAALAAPLALAVGWSAWRRHRLGLEEAALGRRDREALLGSLERSAEAALRRSRIGLVLTIPGWLLALALAALVTARGDVSRWPSLLLSHLLAWDGIASATFVALLMVWLRRRHGRLARERDRIILLRAAYREEDQFERALPPSSGG